jgi:hypothetical protein
MALSKLTVRRLTKLADYMHSLPKEAENHFDMSHFFAHTGDHPIPIEPKKRHYFDCGSSACALGWAATMPYFRKLGLQIHDGRLLVNGRFSWEWPDIFGLDSTDMGFLFSGFTHIRTPKQWAKRCRKFLRDNA